jgi:anti-anti-sigma factor
VIIHRQRRVGDSAAVREAALREGAVLSEAAEESGELRFTRRTSMDGRQVVTVAGELDIATAQQAYTYISNIIDHGAAPISVDLEAVTFCDASGLGVLARLANHAKQAGRQLRLTSPRPSLLKIMRITGLDSAFPDLEASIHLVS